MESDSSCRIFLSNLQKMEDECKKKMDELYKQQELITLPLRKHDSVILPDEEDIKHLLSVAKDFKVQQPVREKQYVETKKNIKTLVSQIVKLQKKLEETEKEYLEKKVEHKGLMKASKHFEKVIIKYSDTFNLLIGIEKQLDESTFIASVQLPSGNKPQKESPCIHLTIDRKTRSVIDFVVLSMEEKELSILKKEVICEGVLNLNILLKRFKDLNNS